MSNGFYFAGRHASDFALTVEKYPAQHSGSRRRTSVKIPGRNGALHLDDGGLDNYIQPYACYFHSTDAAPEQAHAIKAWLLSAGANARLEDGYDPDYFRLATYSGPLDVENILNEYGRCTISFDCDPRYFLKSGEAQIEFSSAGTLHNPTGFDALPLITVYGSGAGVLTVGGIEVEIKSIPSGELVLDCETGNAYCGATNLNGCIYAPEFPVLAAGANQITWSGGITKIEIIPRWWTL